MLDNFKGLLFTGSASLGNRARTVEPELYIVWDNFEHAIAAASVNTSAVEPKGWGYGNRAATNSTSKLSISQGLASFAATGAAAGDPGLWYPTTPRLLGKTFLARATVAAASRSEWGWDSSAAGSVLDSIVFHTTTVLVANVNGTNVVVGVYAAGTYDIALVMRATGMFYFIKGGTFKDWTLIYISALGSAAGFAGIACSNAASTAFYATNPRVPRQLYIPKPMMSDGMSAATTDGSGNTEANGATGQVYTNVGTWGVGGGVRSCSVLFGGIGFSYLNCQSTNVIMDAVCTRSAGVTGMVARYVDSQNYLIAYLDGTNAKLDQVVAGATTNLITAAVTYGAAFVLRLMLDGTEARLFYNNLAVSTVGTTPAAGSKNHGLYTTDTGATFDNLCIWARGTEGQHNVLDVLGARS